MNEVLTYEALKADRDALAVENNKLCKKLTHAEGCFKAAIFEGLDEALVESAGSNLADIVSRRIVHAFPSIGEPTPATSAALAAIEARGVEKFADKRGFSFQHGSVHAHFGNGDVMVGSTKFENGHAGICFAPVREKEGGVGTEYKWTEGKNTNDIGAVFVISSSSVAGLEVIQGKLSEAIEQLLEAK